MLNQLIVGGTVNFTRMVTDYPPSAGWQLKYRIVPRAGGPTPITLTGAQDATDPSLHRVQAPASTTASWTAGVYSWSAWVEKSGEIYDLDSGVVTLLPDPRVATTLDVRSSARVALDNVRALLAGKATNSVLSYTIHGRTLENYSIDELLKLQSRLLQEVKLEDEATAAAAGRPSRRKVYVRCGRG